MALALSAGCVPPHEHGAVEDFAAAFDEMKAEPEFLLARTHPELEVVEEFSPDGHSVEHRRVIPCSLREMQEAGWYPLPPAHVLAVSGTAYSPPVYRSSEQALITVGPGESEADAQYTFRAIAGKWQLTRLEIYSFLESGTAIPPLPCTGP